MKIKYIGVKIDGENAFKEETRITWYPGDENEVQDSTGAKMLKHLDMFAVVGTVAAVKGAEAAAVRIAGMEASGWKDAAGALMSDGNIEAIESHGGPETEKGGALWKHYTGQDYTSAKAVKLSSAPAPSTSPVPPAPPPPTPSPPPGPAPAADKPEGVAVIAVKEGWLVLDGMEAAALRELAKELGVKVHHQAGAPKVIDALVANQKALEKAAAKAGK